jgi:twitching motility protein PilT
MAWTLKNILEGARQLNASDVHLIHGLAPVLRVNGEIQLCQGKPLDNTVLKKLLEEATAAHQRAIFEDRWQLCFSRFWEGIGRCRITLYMRAGCPEMSIRLCETMVRSAEELRLPPIVEEFTHLNNGLILVTGPTGVGKTTTLNFMVNLINRQRRAKIITIEDPVEFVHDNLQSIVIQQEVGTDVHSFQDAIVHVLRQDPDILVIGEMRDLATMETALVAAETGHLVLATLHTPDSVQTVQRIFSVFPAEQQNAIVIQLANSLQGIIAQKLLPRADGKGRVLACEICIATSAVRHLIREQKLHQLYTEMQTGRKLQMQTMDSALLELYREGAITYDMAVSHAREPDTIRHATGDISEED